VLKLKTWHPLRWPLGDQEIAFEVRRMPYGEALAFLAEMVQPLAIADEVERTFDEEGKLKGYKYPDGETADSFNARYRAALPEPSRVRAIFEANVRNVEGLEVDDKPIKKGEELYDVADTQLVIFVLMALRMRTALTAMEGKVSSSPSTSEPEPASAGE
jgi:hypothetical protein